MPDPLETCANCGEPFTPDTPGDELCFDCELDEACETADCDDDIDEPWEDDDP